MTFAALLKSIRIIHRYLGLVFATTIIFFATTGGLQMFGLHETARGSSYVPSPTSSCIFHNCIRKGRFTFLRERLLHPTWLSLMGLSWMLQNSRLQSLRKQRRDPTRFP
jgi:hypothetical protein